jgi:MarR family transcriptional regulator, transcriptional regulator for hemolysin
MRGMDSVIFDIIETSRHLRRAFDRRALASGATPTQWRVLVKLARMGDGQRQIDLAESIDVEAITLGRMIDRLEQAGLVERRRDDADRRAWRIFLTPAAAPVVETLQTLGDQFHADALEGLSLEDIQAARRVLEHIRSNLVECGAGAARKVL